MAANPAVSTFSSLAEVLFEDKEEFFDDFILSLEDNFFCLSW